LFGLAGRRGGAGSGEGPSVNLCAHGLREPAQGRAGGGIAMLSFGLRGADFIGPVHAAIIAAHPGARLAWVVDLNVAAGKTLADRYGARVTASLEEALADADVQAVVICTPPRTHAALIEA